MLRILVTSYLALSTSFISTYTYADIEITNVSVTDVTPSSFTVNWHSSSVSTPQIELFDSLTLDNNITSSFEVEYYPLRGTKASLPSEYEQTEYIEELKSVIQTQRLSRVQVRGLDPDTEYFFKVSSSSDSDSGSWPLINAQSIKTEVENSFVHDSIQLVVDVNEEGSRGWIVQASLEGGRYPVSAVVEDGAEVGQAVLNLSNVFTSSQANLQAGLNVSPVISVLKESGEVSSELFENIVLNNEFSVATSVLVVLDDKSLPLPPEIGVVDSIVSYEGGLVEFSVTVTDPNETIPALTIDAAPTGSEFSYSDSGESAGQGIFRWNPQIGQQGDYLITLIANDGELETQASVSIKVNPVDDKDGDDLNDDWEITFFGDLTQSSDGDYDSDGYSNFEEYQNGWNPTLITQIPSAPVIQSPIFDAEVAASSPVLTVVNSVHSADIVVEYLFEVYSDESMSENVFTTQVAEGEGITSVIVEEQEGAVLADNSLYYWRVRGTSPAGGREWVNGQFFLNTQNDLPSVPSVRYPSTDSLVSTFTPVLSINNSSDIDHDELKYNFSLFTSGSDLDSTPLYTISNLVPGRDGYTEWQVPESLEEDVKYVWYVDVIDEHGATSRSELSSFLVSSRNDSPNSPVLSSPTGMQEVTTLQPTFVWGRVLDPEGAGVHYELHVNTSESFDELTNLSFEVVQADDEMVQWNLQETLEDNTQYYWRVNSNDGELTSDWSDSSFFVNTANDAPNTPTIANPASGAVVEVLQPLLSVNPSQDLDRDSIKYRFELYSDVELTVSIGEALVDNTEWQVPQALTDNSFYYWRVRAEDEHAAMSGWSETYSFFVNNQGINDPSTFQFLLPSSDIELIDGEVLIQWMDSDPDSSALISLWYENSEGNASLIQENISEDLDGDSDQFTWHISDLDVGDYRIKAVIADEESSLTVQSSYLVKIVPAVGVIETNLITSNQIDEFGVELVRVDVTLDRPPVLDNSVTVNIRVSDESEASIDKVIQGNEIKPNNYLYFTKENWNTPISIFVKGLDDCEIDGSQAVDLIFEGVASGDTGFDGVDPEDIVLSNLDNEVDGQTLFICSYLNAGVEVSSDGAFIDQSYTAQLKNTGGERLNPSAKLLLVDESLELVGNNSVSFPNIGADQTLDSLETFTVRHAANVEPDTAKFKWEIFSEPPRADLKIKLDGRDGKWSDGVFKFAAIVMNDGPSSSLDVELTISIPMGVSVYSVDGAECLIQQADIVCKIEQIAKSESREVLVTIETDDSKAKYSFNASVSSTVNDEDESNNSTEEEFGGAWSLLGLLALVLMLAYRRKTSINKEVV